jgi:hypothetical protein
MSDLYFQRYAYPKRFITNPIKENTFVCVVIPVYKEYNLLPTLDTLIECDKTQLPVEIIFVINHPDNAEQKIKEQSQKTVRLIEEYIENHETELTFHVIKAFELPSKNAGVGLARKIGMDEAAYRLNSINQDGVILCFDADSLCETNYLKEIESHFLENPKCNGASIHYEHPLYFEDGTENEAIILYELHLRYYIQSLKYTGYPFAFHTIGSSMAVRSSVYQKQGGMNQRKAGEDFYFLHKIIPLGDYQNINSTKVIPSSRLSDRVPFGTGRAMQEYKNHSKDLKLSYDFDSFKLIKSILEEIKTNKTDKLPEVFKTFLKENNFLLDLEKIQSQSKNDQHFKERFFVWFNGFKMLKLVHYLRADNFPEKLLTIGSNQLLNEIGITDQKELSALQLLEIFRDLDKNN